MRGEAALLGDAGTTAALTQVGKICLRDPRVKKGYSKPGAAGVTS